MKKHYIILAILTIVSSFSSEARWANPDDAKVEYEFSNNEIKIFKDGSFEEIHEEKYKILTEDARDGRNYQLHYNGYSEKLEILEAYTLANGKKYQVEPDFIVDKVISSVGKGFDEIRQVSISFARVERNSEIYLRYKFSRLKPSINDFFATRFDYLGSYYKSSNTKILSELPLNIIVNDPKKSLKVSNVKDPKTKLNKLEISLIKPIIEYSTGYDEGVLDLKRVTYVAVSSEKKWQELSKKCASPYYEVASQDLPESFQEIFEAANKLDSDVEKINKVTSGINEKVRYMGDWRTVRGQFFPNNLSLIAKLQTGDCKDFSASTAAILKKLGYKIQFAFVWRGDYEYSFEEKLPTLYNTNHVILKVTNKDDKVFWIDPTNFVSMADGIFSDIENRNALILEKEGGNLEKIPKIDEKHARVSRVEEIKILDNSKNIIEVKSKFLIKGEYAQNLTGIRLNLSEEAVKEAIFKSATGLSLSWVKDAKIKTTDLNSTIVKDIDIDIEYQSENSLGRSNLGSYFVLSTIPSINHILKCDFSQIRDLDMGHAYIAEKTFIFKDTKIKNLETIDCEIKTEWFDLERSAFYQNNDTVIKLKLISHGGLINSEELKTSKFSDLHKKLEKNFKDFTVILDSN